MTEPDNPVVTPEVLAQIVHLLPSVLSLRDLCAVTGLRLATVRRVTAPFLAIMKLQGTHPKCGCGRDRFHPYGCADSYAKGDREGLVPGRTAEQAAAVLSRRQRVIELLLQGHRFVDINAAMGFNHRDARKYLRFLSPEEMAARSRAIEERANASPTSKQSKGAQDAR